MLGLSPDPIKDYETVSLREDTQSSGDTSFRKSKKGGKSLLRWIFSSLLPLMGSLFKLPPAKLQPINNLRELPVPPCLQSVLI